jgi:transcriptional regulator NrdR family protein
VRGGLTGAGIDSEMRSGPLKDLVGEISERARRNGPEITSDAIRRWVLEGLRETDEAAHLRFAESQRDAKGRPGV